MKKAAIIFGVGVVVGIAAIAILSSVNKETEEAPTTEENKTPNNGPKPTAPTTSTPVSEADRFESEKSSVVSSVTERHEEAAQIIRDAVTIICEQTEQSDSTDEELQQISSELDDLLNEE